MKDSRDRGQDPEQNYQDAEAVRDLRRLLSPRERECVELRAEGFSYAEIAGIMDLRPGTVGATLARAHRKFRRAATEREDEKLTTALGSRVMLRGEDSYSS
jgi:DNA-directed RNA polymerase specialized sigma24 family protein